MGLNVRIYLCIEEFGGKLYVDIRDYFHPDGPDDGLLHTGRGIKMDLKGFHLFKDFMCAINDKWTEAISVLPAPQSPIKTVRAKSDPMEDNSQVIFCDWLIMICNALLKAVPYRRFLKMVVKMTLCFPLGGGLFPLGNANTDDEIIVI